MSASNALCECHPTNRLPIPSVVPGTEGRGALPAELPSGDLWYALHVRSNFELKISVALERDGIEQFLPAQVEISRWTDRTKQIKRPLFAGYLFARFDRFHDAAQILRTTGVIGILGHTETDSIPDETIASLRVLVASPAPVTPCRYLSGVAVRVERGPYAGATGVVLSTRGKSFLTINVEAFGRACKVEFDVADIKQLDAPDGKAA